MKFSFHPEAEGEFEQAADYYEEREEGLGYDFAVEVFSAIELASSYPSAWPLVEDKIRRVLVNRFPFGIIYAQKEGMIFVLAVMHMHREPDYWKHRILED
ncbi:MAG: type II toxin-antitoxin system RelE/ParE family toxin [Nitrospirae bacterium]|nr:type II toxin-antitoxin system RelE/ParE family toxin [Nitrospirota bacterium]MBI5695344.1 type II toxin-antitoxin system RelE/ParE family toxin [Nitrospirota bacterium]